jgi:hypothetical protein
MFNDLVIDKEITGEKDTLGGARILPTDVYDFTIKLAYVSVADSGARAINLSLEGANGNILRVTEYVTSGTAKGGKNTYTDKNGKQQYLPGFSKMNALCNIVAGLDLPSMDFEEKVISLYNYEAQKELPTKVTVIMNLVNQKVKAAVIHKIENKSQKNAEGKYTPIAETRELNEVDRFFTEDGFTSSELLAKEESPTFINTWIEKNQGKVVDKTSKDVLPSGVSSGAPKASSTTSAAPSKSLFA